jgi:hypothetical protein
MPKQTPAPKRELYSIKERTSCWSVDKHEKSMAIPALPSGRRGGNEAKVPRYT